MSGHHEADDKHVGDNYNTAIAKLFMQASIPLPIRWAWKTNNPSNISEAIDVEKDWQVQRVCTSWKRRKAESQDDQGKQQLAHVEIKSVMHLSVVHFFSPFFPVQKCAHDVFSNHRINDSLRQHNITAKNANVPAGTEPIPYWI